MGAMSRLLAAQSHIQKSEEQRAQATTASVNADFTFKSYRDRTAQNLQNFIAGIPDAAVRAELKQVVAAQPNIISEIGAAIQPYGLSQMMWLMPIPCGGLTVGWYRRNAVSLSACALRESLRCEMLNTCSSRRQSVVSSSTEIRTAFVTAFVIRLPTPNYARPENLLHSIRKGR